jgi:hypothetical protein
LFLPRRARPPHAARTSSRRQWLRSRDMKGETQLLGDSARGHRRAPSQTRPCFRYCDHPRTCDAPALRPRAAADPAVSSDTFAAPSESTLAAPPWRMLSCSIDGPDRMIGRSRMAFGRARRSVVVAPPGSRAADFSTGTNGWWIISARPCGSTRWAVRSNRTARLISASAPQAWISLRGTPLFGRSQPTHNLPVSPSRSPSTTAPLDRRARSIASAFDHPDPAADQWSLVLR